MAPGGSCQTALRLPLATLDSLFLLGGPPGDRCALFSDSALDHPRDQLASQGSRASATESARVDRRLAGTRKNVPKRASWPPAKGPRCCFPLLSACARAEMSLRQSHCRLQHALAILLFVTAVSAELLDHAILAAGRAGTAGNDPYVDPHRKAAARITHHREDSLEWFVDAEKCACARVVLTLRVDQLFRLRMSGGPEWRARRMRERRVSSDRVRFTVEAGPWRSRLRPAFTFRHHAGSRKSRSSGNDLAELRSLLAPPPRGLSRRREQVRRTFNDGFTRVTDADAAVSCRLLQPQGKHEDERFSTRDLLVMGGFACIDTSRSLTSCGGCSTTGPGRDCTKIRHADGVTCREGRCLVLSCQRGWRPSLTGQHCLRGRVTGGLKVGDSLSGRFHHGSRPIRPVVLDSVP